MTFEKENLKSGSMGIIYLTDQGDQLGLEFLQKKLNVINSLYY